MRKTRCILITEKDLTDLELEFNKLVEFYEEFGWEVRDVLYIKTPDNHNYNVIISKESNESEVKKPFVKPEMVELNTGRSKKPFIKPELVVGKIVEDPFICKGSNYTPNNKGSKENQIIGSIAGIEELLAERMIKSSKYDSQLFLNHLLRDILGGV